jgi:hypothetical protein
METFIVKIYRNEKRGNKLVGTLQNINSDQQLSFTSAKELYNLLAGMIAEEEDSESDEPDSA